MYDVPGLIMEVPFWIVLVLGMPYCMSDRLFP